MKRFVIAIAATATLVAGIVLPFSGAVADTVGPDSAFADGGMKTMAILGGADEASAALVQPDGKIVVTGPTSYPNADGQWFLIRTDADGKNLDPGFGNQNIFGNTFFQGDAGKSVDLARGSDGSLFVSGQSTTSGLLMKLTSAGKVDSTFGSAGKVTVPAPGGGVFLLQKVVVANNTVTVAGVNAAGTTLRVARFNLNGTPVSSFGNNGIADVNLTVVSNVAVKPNVSLQVDASNRAYVLVGNENVINGVATQLVRLNADGTKDASYGGVVGDQAMHGRGLVLLSDGTAAAGIVDWKTTKAALQVFDTAGKPTVRTVVPGTALDYPRGLTQSGDRLVLAARGTGSESAVKVFGFTKAGAVDTNFANNGAYVYTNANASFIAPSNITVDSQGRLLVPGAYTPKTGGLDAFSDVAVYRFKVTVTSTPTPTPTPTVTATPTPTPTPTLTASPSATAAGPVITRPAVQLGVPGVVRAKTFAAITGTASGTSLTRVQVALRRVDKKKERKGICQVLNASGRIRPMASPTRSCATPLVALPATGTRSWLVTLNGKLKPGKYVISTRATGAGGTSDWSSRALRVKK